MSAPTIRLGAPGSGDDATLSAALAARSRKKLLQERIHAAAGSSEEPGPGIPRRIAGATAPLSLSQRQLWYLNQLAPDSSAYNECATLRKTGPLDSVALRAAFNEFVRRHEAWRTTFEPVDGEPRQVVHEPTVYPLPILDLSALSPEAAELRAAEVAAEDTRRPYNLATGPLLRPRLVRLAPDNHRLYLGLHHIVFDGVTLYRVFLPEIVSLYDAYSEGQPSPLAEPAAQYPDYAAWEVDWANGPDGQRRIDYWREHLDGVPATTLPLEYPRPSIRRIAGGTVPIRVDAVTADLLRGAAQRGGATLFQLLTGLYAWWLGRYSGEDEAVFATVADMRQKPELGGMVGYCLAPIVIRADLSGNPDVQQLVDRVRGELLDGLDNAVPFQWLVQQLGGVRDPRMNPLFQASFELEPPLLSPDPSWSLHQMDVLTSGAVGQSKFDLTIELDERPEGHIDGRLLYDAELFTAGSAEQMARHWSHLLDSVATGLPGQPLAELDSAESVGQLPGDLDFADFDELRIEDLIHDQVERRPDAFAVVSAGRSITYSQLEESARAVASRLVAAGAGPETVVAVVLDRSVDLVVGLLGVLISGAAYLPLDPRHPEPRLRFLVADAGANLLLTQSSFSPALPDLGVPAIMLDQLSDARALNPRSSVSVSAENLAYVMYTSGSTGQPKGVGVEHRSVTHLMRTLLQRVGLSSGDVIVSVSSYTFDGSVGDIFCGLGLGARIVLASSEQQADPRALRALLDQSGATFMEATPTTWAGLVQAGWRANSDFTVACGGETLPADLAGELLERSSAVWNFFGPTETTVWATSGRVEREEPLTVGTPLPGTRVYIIDADGRRTPDGVPGEIAIGGPQVARGYIARPEETIDRFRADSHRDHGRVYRTGDRGRQLIDGRIQHMGRLDGQLKIRGHRVEPGEVEATIRRHPAIRDAAVGASTRHPNRSLIAYVVTGPAQLDEIELRAWLRARLPEYLVPSRFIRMKTLPRNSSGKLDRKALATVVPLAATGLGGENFAARGCPEKTHGPSGPLVEASGYGKSDQDGKLLELVPDGSYAAPKKRAKRPQAPRTFGSVDPLADMAWQRGAIADTIEQIWQKLLGCERLDLEASFFDVGGHSLLAVNLVMAAERTFGVRLDLSSVIASGPTINSMAALVGQLLEPATSRVVPAAAGHRVNGLGRAPIFFLYPNLASISLHRHFAPTFSRVSQPIVWSLDDPAFGRTSATPLGELAASFLMRIRDEQPTGPIRIGGYSLGGLVAYAAAGQLLSHGGQVNWLCLIDAATPSAAAHSVQPWRRIVRGARHGPAMFVVRGASILQKAVRQRMLPRFGRRGLISTTRRAKEAPIVGNPAPLVVVASANSALACRSRTLGWEDVHAGPITLVEVPGDHVTMFDFRLKRPLADLVLDTLLASVDD